jgi:hypothetical protein
MSFGYFEKDQNAPWPYWSNQPTRLGLTDSVGPAHRSYSPHTHTETLTLISFPAPVTLDLLRHCRLPSMNSGRSAHRRRSHSTCCATLLCMVRFDLMGVSSTWVRGCGDAYRCRGAVDLMGAWW